MIRIDVSASLYPSPAICFSLCWHLTIVQRISRMNFVSAQRLDITFFKKLTAIAKLDIVQSFYNGSEEVAENGIFSNNTEYVSPTLEVGYAVRRNGVLHFPEDLLFQLRIFSHRLILALDFISNINGNIFFQVSAISVTPSFFALTYIAADTFSNLFNAALASP